MIQTPEHDFSAPASAQEQRPSMGQLIEQLREAGEDFEFYPTTDEIIARLAWDIGLRQEGAGGNTRRDRGLPDSVLDIGAGNGKVLRALGELCGIGSLYAIEKSAVLCEQLDPNIFIVGTDFHEQSLVAKQVGVTFCNPPYSEFEAWAVKIIRETASKYVYLVVPVRWEKSANIAAAIKYREAKYRTIGKFDFHKSEDRATRTADRLEDNFPVVHLIRIELCGEKDDAFDRFFDVQFAELKAKFCGVLKKGDESDDDQRGETTAKSKFSSLVVGQNYPERLVELYDAEMDHIRKNYDLVAKLDADLLREFEVTPVRILQCLKARLAGLRNTYWKELFDHMQQVTDRLTMKKRRVILDRLNQSGQVDFTLGNIHAIIIWVLKNANTYIDTQLVETFEAMVDKANVRNYVSNTRAFVFDRWRYLEEKPSHIALEYRLVLQHIGGLKLEFKAGEYSLNETACDFLGDMLTIARNLGFNCQTGDVRLDRWNKTAWKAGGLQEFTMKRRDYEVGDKVPWTATSKKVITEKVQLEGGAWQYLIDGQWVHQNCLAGEVLFDVRAHLNGNIHIRLNQKFALALNVEYGRLKGWLKNGQEAADELGDREAGQYFQKNLQLGVNSLPMLAGSAA